MRTQGQGRLYPTWLTGGRVRAHVCMWWWFFFPHYGQYSQDRMSGVQIQTVASMHVIPVCRTGCLADGIKYHSSLPLPRLVAGEWGMFCNHISWEGPYLVLMFLPSGLVVLFIVSRLVCHQVSVSGTKDFHRVLSPCAGVSR